MIIKDITQKIKCEMPNCKNLSTIRIEKQGFFKSAGITICADCMKEMYLEFSKRIVPKSPENMLNKKISLKREQKSEK